MHGHSIASSGYLYQATIIMWDDTPTTLCIHGIIVDSINHLLGDNYANLLVGKGTHLAHSRYRKQIVKVHYMHIIMCPSFLKCMNYGLVLVS